MPGCNGDWDNISEDYAPHLYENKVFVNSKKEISEQEKRCNVKVSNIKLKECLGANPILNEIGG